MKASKMKATTNYDYIKRKIFFSVRESSYQSSPPPLQLFSSILALPDNGGKMLHVYGLWKRGHCWSLHLFINVSNNLPKTAFIKMINISCENPPRFNDESREINHHGETRHVGEEEEDEKPGMWTQSTLCIPTHSCNREH